MVSDELAHGEDEGASAGLKAADGWSGVKLLMRELAFPSGAIPLFYSETASVGMPG